MSQPGDDEQELASALLALGRLTSRASLRRELGVEHTPLSPTDSWLLDHLLETGPARMSELAHWQSVDRSTMTSQVGKLERLALAQRAQDEADRRAVLVSLTADGQELALQSRRLARDVYCSVVADWTDQERSQLATSLRHLVTSIERHLA